MDYLGSCCDGDLEYTLHPPTGNEWYLFDRFHRSIWWTWMPESLRRRPCQMVFAGGGVFCTKEARYGSEDFELYARGYERRIRWRCWLPRPLGRSMSTVLNWLFRGTLEVVVVFSDNVEWVTRKNCYQADRIQRWLG